MIDRITEIGAKLTSFRFIVVVQQKSKGSRNSAGGPRGATTGGNTVELV